jgi:hypothetical protein
MIILLVTEKSNYIFKLCHKWNKIGEENVIVLIVQY